MLKGFTEFYVEFFIFAALIAFMVSILGPGGVRTEVTLKNAGDALDAIDASHLIERCIGDNGVVSLTSTDQLLQRIDLCALGRDVSVRIRDLETGKEWGMVGDGRIDYSLPILVNDGKGPHIGEMDVTL